MLALFQYLGSDHQDVHEFRRRLSAEGVDFTMPASAFEEPKAAAVAD